MPKVVNIEDYRPKAPDGPVDDWEADRQGKVKVRSRKPSEERIPEWQKLGLSDPDLELERLRASSRRMLQKLAVLTLTLLFGFLVFEGWPLVTWTCAALVYIITKK